MTLSCFSNDVFSLSVQKRTMIIFGQILTIWAIVIVVRKAFYTKAIIVFGDGFGSFFECIRRRRAFSWAATEALSPWPRTSADMDKTLDFDRYSYGGIDNLNNFAPTQSIFVRALSFFTFAMQIQNHALFWDQSKGPESVICQKWPCWSNSMTNFYWLQNKVWPHFIRILMLT